MFFHQQLLNWRTWHLIITSISWQCNHSDPDDLWMVYKCMVVDANEVIGRPGSALIWIVFVHEKVKSDPSLVMGYKSMYTAHGIEAGNLKKILESRYKVRCLTP